MERPREVDIEQMKRESLEEKTSVDDTDSRHQG